MRWKSWLLRKCDSRLERTQGYAAGVQEQEWHESASSECRSNDPRSLYRGCRQYAESTSPTQASQPFCLPRSLFANPVLAATPPGNFQPLYAVFSKTVVIPVIALTYSRLYPIG